MFRPPSGRSAVPRMIQLALWKDGPVRLTIVPQLTAAPWVLGLLRRLWHQSRHQFQALQAAWHSHRWVLPTQQETLSDIQAGLPRVWADVPPVDELNRARQAFEQSFLKSNASQPVCKPKSKQASESAAKQVISLDSLDLLFPEAAALSSRHASSVRRRKARYVSSIPAPSRPLHTVSGTLVEPKASATPPQGLLPTVSSASSMPEITNDSLRFLAQRNLFLSHSINTLAERYFETAID